ncbi:MULTISPECIES: LysR substrate-binding domain-containing protein [unclassified Ensifer]|uniref:LysR substrate-binding domain-containing protein n=1 Tax=unclassified Ensifer TaxID=2633371 RepID=UPI0009E9E8A0|nr:MULTISPECIES: LysR substrate-binding domain-containing protein [unclassified Ensifer]
MLAEFASAVEAVRAAVDIQNDLAERSLDLPENNQMKFRIGINLGDVLVDGDNLFGDGVNIAVRLEGVAEPGGVCLSSSVYEHVERKLPLPYVDIGPQRLKNIARPIHAFRVSIPRTSENLLSITAIHTFATNWLALRLGAFQTAHRDLELRLEVMSRVVDFAREPFDVGIRAGNGRWPGLVSHELMAEEFAPFCSPDFLAGAGNISAPSDLLALPLLRDDDWWRAWFKAAGFGDSEPKISSAVFFNTQIVVSQAALAGQGVALLTPAFAPDIKAGRLVQLFNVIARNGTSLWLVYPEERENSRKIRAVREWLLDEIQRAR